MNLVADSTKPSEKTRSNEVAVRQTQCMAVVDRLHLPPEALTTRLAPRDLINFVADLQKVGAGARKSDSTLWRDVARRGAGKVLADTVREAHGIPENVAQGKSAKQLLDGVAHLKLLGGNPRSARAWQGLDLLESDKITREQFKVIFADGRDVAANVRLTH